MNLIYSNQRKEKTINELAAENNIQPNLLRNWKNEFLQNASIVFDEKRDENILQKLEEERTEKAAYAKKVGQLKLRGHNVGRKKARRYMAEMDITPIYPKMNLSKRMKEAKVCPYLLRDAVITRPNQAWPIDITYIPIKHGFLYLTAVIDWYSRCIVGWEVGDTLKYDEACLTQYANIRAARSCIARYIPSKPGGAAYISKLLSIPCVR